MHSPRKHSLKADADLNVRARETRNRTANDLVANAELKEDNAESKEVSAVCVEDSKAA